MVIYSNCFKIDIIFLPVCGSSSSVREQLMHDVHDNRANGRNRRVSRVGTVVLLIIH